MRRVDSENIYLRVIGTLSQLPVLKILPHAAMLFLPFIDLYMYANIFYRVRARITTVGENIEEEGLLSQYYYRLVKNTSATECVHEGIFEIIHKY